MYDLTNLSEEEMVILHDALDHYMFEVLEDAIHPAVQKLYEKVLDAGKDCLTK